MPLIVKWENVIQNFRNDSLNRREIITVLHLIFQFQVSQISKMSFLKKKVILKK